MKYVLVVDGKTLEVCSSLEAAQERAAAFLSKSDDIVLDEYQDDAPAPVTSYRFDPEANGLVMRPAP